MAVDEAIAGNPEIINRFERHFSPEPNTGCWLWHSSVTNKGYGEVSINNKRYNAHRASWLLYRGCIPDADDYHGTCVLHKCDTRLCVNPEHLFLGTNNDNIKDSMNKNRRKGILRKRPSGLKYKVKLEDDIADIRVLHSYGMTKNKLAKEYGVCHYTIERMLVI